MPLYEYHCPCGNELEILQKMNEAPETHCPKCGKNTLVKQVSAAGFQLKGTGWYETDFKDKPAKKQPKETKPAKKADTSKASDKTSKKEHKD